MFDDPDHSIVILGIPGAGKTIFVAALEESLKHGLVPGVMLDPQNKATHDYVTRVWSALQRGELPPGTPPGLMVRLSWTLRMPWRPDTTLHVVDSAGQDFKEIFGAGVPTLEEPWIPDGETSPSTPTFQVVLPGLAEHLQGPALVCRSATLAVLLVDLGQFLGDADPGRRNEKELALKFALDYYRREKIDCCLVLTKWDSLQASARGLEPRAFARRQFPLIGPLYLENPQFPVFPVASVNQWRVAIQQEGNQAVLIPAEEFHSEGLKPFVEWMTRRLRIRWWTSLAKSVTARWGWILLTLVLGLFVLSKRFTVPPPPTPPRFEINELTASWSTNFILYPDTLIIEGVVINTGESEGPVSVEAVVSFGSRNWTKVGVSRRVDPHESVPFAIPVKTEMDVRQKGVKYGAYAR